MLLSISRNIVECKLAKKAAGRRGVIRISRNIVECKYPFVLSDLLHVSV